MHRFSRLEMLIGSEALDRLRRASITVVGLGAVGSYAAEGLARAAIGHLRLVDFDVVRLSNINRQLYALESTLGLPKVLVAAKRIADINPACNVEPIQLFVDATTAQTVLNPPPDILIDAIDSVSPKVELLAAAVCLGIPTVSVMGAALRTNPAAVKVADLAKTRYCPLARFVRKRLAQRGIRSGIICVYSEEPATTMRMKTNDRLEEEGVLSRGRPRRLLGSLSTLPGIFGLWAATEAIRLLISSNMRQTQGIRKAGESPGGIGDGEGVE